MKAQAIFNKVVNHLRKQNKQAIIPNSFVGYGATCQYRTIDGLKCAAGALIQKSEYHPKMEYNDIRYLLSEEQVKRGMTPKSMYDRLHPYVELIVSLQNAHDGHNPSQWEPQFKRIAKEYHLKYIPPPKN